MAGLTIQNSFGLGSTMWAWEPHPKFRVTNKIYIFKEILKKIFFRTNFCHGTPTVHRSTLPMGGSNQPNLVKIPDFPFDSFFVSCVDILFNHSQKKVIILQLFLEFEFAAQFVFETQIQIYSATHILNEINFGESKLSAFIFYKVEWLFKKFNITWNYWQNLLILTFLNYAIFHD